MENLTKKPKQLWIHPFGYKESFIISFAILLTGFLIQFTTRTYIIAPPWPFNLLILINFVLMVSLITLFIKHPLVKWLSSVPAAIAAIVTFTALILMMGFIPQGKPESPMIIHRLGLSVILQSWPYLLSSFYLLTILGFTTARRVYPFNFKNFSFLLNHAGLWLVIVTASLGVSDIKKLYIQVNEGETAWTAYDANMKPYQKLPFAIQLVDFRIDEYAPELVLFNHITGKLKTGSKEKLSCDDSVTVKHFGDAKVKIIKYLPLAKFFKSDFYINNSMGASHAVKISITVKDKTGTEWISCGSMSEKPRILALNDSISIAMTIPSTKKYVSDVKIYTPDQKISNQTITVNHPIKVDGWEVYQTSYDERMGRWSKTSVFELVHDSWLKAVYVGIFMMLAGGISLFFIGKNKVK